jgi:hypothetical protein
MTEVVTTPPLLDLFAPPANADANDRAATDEALGERAEHLLDFALAEHERIKALDVGMGRIALNYEDPRGAAAMRRMYQQWADQSDGLLRRVKQHGLHGRLGAKFDALQNAVGFTLAMLSLTLESLRSGAEQVRRGETVSIEEVRRELRARSRG